MPCETFQNLPLFWHKNWLIKKYHATSQKFYIIVVVLALFFNFKSFVLFQPRKEETWLLTQLICLLRKQPHNDFHYRTWNWFCYDNCCICNCCKILFVEIQNWNSKKSILQKRLLSKYIEKLERLCNNNQFQVTWSISGLLSRYGVFFHSIFIRKPFNLSPCSI